MGLTTQVHTRPLMTIQSTITYWIIEIIWKWNGWKRQRTKWLLSNRTQKSTTRCIAQAKTANKLKCNITAKVNSGSLKIY